MVKNAILGSYHKGRTKRKTEDIIPDAIRSRECCIFRRSDIVSARPLLSLGSLDCDPTAAERNEVASLNLPAGSIRTGGGKNPFGDATIP
jgi:hypothetical protein